MRKRRLLVLLLAFALSAVTIVVVANRMDRSGRAFFQTGKQIVAALDNIAQAVRKKDVGVIALLYSSDYTGASLGLTQLFEPGDKEDGIFRKTTTAPESSQDRQAAIAEWQAYLASFETIEEAGLHLNRLEQWDAEGPLTATIRFELIGTPIDRSRPVIDRARFRIKFDVKPDGLLIHKAYPIEGERLSAEAPQFTEVGS